MNRTQRRGRVTSKSNTYLSVNLSEIEKQALRILAANHGRAGVDLSTYIRDVVLASHEPYQTLVAQLTERMAEQTNA